MNKEELEFIESRSRSFSQLWPVASDNIIKDGYVISLGDTDSSRYLPMARPELPGQFAKLSGGTEEDVLDFVRLYGLPGYNRAFRFPLEVISAHELRLYDDKAPGDPLSWVFAHADAVNLVLQLADALNTPHKLETIIGRLLVEEEGSVRLSYKAPYRGQALPGRVTTVFDTYEAAAHRIITLILNSNLEGVSKEIIYEYQDDGKIGPTALFQFQNLLDCIYWLAAEAVVGKKVRTCGFCGKAFIAPNERTVYCPPLLWESVSRCMNNAKQRRFRERQRQKAMHKY